MGGVACQNLPPPQYCALLSVADVCLITSLRDVMNLTSHEYVVCQQGRCSPLVLSEFAGTYGSLAGAIRINPWNTQVRATPRASRRASRIRHSSRRDGGGGGSWSRRRPRPAGQEVCDAIHDALTMDGDERAARQAELMGYIRSNTGALPPRRAGASWRGNVAGTPTRIGCARARRRRGRHAADQRKGGCTSL